MQIFGEIGVLADDGDRVQCHICGKWFSGLGIHVSKSHDMESTDYKDAFGLARNLGLSSTSYKDKLRSSLNTRLSDFLSKSGGAERCKNLTIEQRSKFKKTRAISSKKANSNARKKEGSALRLQTPEVRAKATEAMKLTKNSEEFRAKLSNKKAKTELYKTKPTSDN